MCALKHALWPKPIHTFLLLETKCIIKLGYRYGNKICAPTYIPIVLAYVEEKYIYIYILELNRSSKMYFLNASNKTGKKT